MKLAYFSPLNPQPSGISDYSEELLPHLAAHADIELFVDGFRPGNQELLARFRLFDYRRDPSALARLGDYDAVVYHMGNDHRYHSGIFDAMRQHPGVVVFHDFALQDFFLGLSRQRANAELYLLEMAACHGERERDRAGEHLLRGSVPPHVAAPLAFPLNCRLAREAEGIIVHSAWSRERFDKIAPGVPSAHINHHITTRAAATEPAGVERGDEGACVRFASFGLITPDKGIESALRALSALRDEHDFHYTLVGADNSYFDVRALIHAHGLSDRVTITGHVSLAEFERRIAGTDIAINLRERFIGATSGSLCRIMAAGVPAIVSNVGSFAELPNDTVVKIDTDEYADALLWAYLRKLLEDAGLRRRIGANARRHMLAEHSIEQSAARYAAFIHDVIARRTRRLFVVGISDELSLLGVRPDDETLMRSVASEVAALAPAVLFETDAHAHQVAVETHAAQTKTTLNANGHHAAACQSAATRVEALKVETEANGVNAAFDVAMTGRLPKIEGVDYKRAAVEYPRKLDAERSYYLRTKPFYNLAHKPDKHAGDGMDAETHRHFCDFANVAVALALPAGARLLDVGCGSGWLGEYFARLGYDVTGIDISDDLIEMASERVARVPYDVDHETPLRCRFETHDIESAPLPEKFDAVICYDSLHHFVDERAVFRHFSAMLEVGGLLFILEGHKPPAGSATEEELTDVMRLYETLESPYSYEYLRELLDANGFAVVGDYVSVNGLFEREMLEHNRLPLTTVATDYHYLTCKKVAENARASVVPDSRAPGVLCAQITLRAPLPESFAPGARLEAQLAVKNTGDTLWLNGQTVRAGVVMPGVRVSDARGNLIQEFHGQPMLPRAVAPGETVTLRIEYAVPPVAGAYTLKIDLVDQHVCWFEDRGSEPLVFKFEVSKGEEIQ
ncbi:MAG: methyltransferase domain-containing protein [Acidobacteria bacterium]|nr:methyltransferase domain-containing protein [Acidobacteriota bacterium]